MVNKKKNNLVVADGGLIGKYFHSFHDDRVVNWQGQIVGIPHPDYVLVELFSWLSGRPNGGKLVPIKDIAYNWNIYECEEDMADAWDDLKHIKPKPTI